MFTLGKYVRPYEAVTIVRNKQGNEVFDLNDISRLVKYKVLNLYVEFVSPESSSVMFFDGEIENEEDFDTKFKYKRVAERAVHNPVDTNIYLSNAKSYDLEKSVDEELIEKGFFEYFSKSKANNKLDMPYQLNSVTYREYDSAWWLISKKELQDYLNNEQKINEKSNIDKSNVYLQREIDWDKLADHFNDGRGRLLVWALKGMVESGLKNKLGDVFVVRDWILAHKAIMPFTPYEIKADGKSLLVKPPNVTSAKHEKWRSDKISDSWDKVKAKYVKL